MFTEVVEPTALQRSPVVSEWLAEPSAVRIGWHGTPNAPCSSEL